MNFISFFRMDEGDRGDERDDDPKTMETMESQFNSPASDSAYHLDLDSDHAATSPDDDMSLGLVEPPHAR
jgi:hypothetical protein